MIEPFRPVLADSTVIQVVNNGEVKPDGFVSAAGSVNLKPHARRAFIAAYERRLDQEVTHPLFGYRVSMRRLLEVEARLLARHAAEGLFTEERNREHVERVDLRNYDLVQRSRPRADLAIDLVTES